MGKPQPRREEPMNDETTFQQKKNIIWDTDGSPDSITALLYFL